jgi:hypothetical protein
MNTVFSPLLAQTRLAGAESSGNIDLHLVYRRAPRHVELRGALHDIYVEDQDGRFSMYGLDGALDWSSAPALRVSRLGWQAARLYNIDIGASELRLRSESGGLQLDGQASIPVFDGKLTINELGVENLSKGATRWSLDAALSPVSMELFSHAMGWPVMGGKLSGIIPEVRYAEDRLVVGGAVLVRIFDGDVVLHNLSLARPLGPVPVLSGDIDFSNLDLAALTRTFSFGSIEGRLGGVVHRLRLVDWRPVQFDARFATPENDRSRHRISQKAVNSLTTIGGGSAGALSRSFLRIFENFSYKRLGISCRLRNGVCEMGGIEAAKQGYYIVRGGGIPRIDVIGYNPRVDWNVLIERLKQVTASEGPVIR